MRKIAFVLLAVAGLAFSASATAASKKGADKPDFRYDIEYVKSVGTGISSIKVWSYAKKAQDAMNESRRNAVHGIIFKGYAGAGASFSPLSKSPSAMTDHADFFNNFFADGGDYMRYVSSVQEGSDEVVKFGKEYKFGQIVNVNVKELRKALENAGVIKGLSSGF